MAKQITRVVLRIPRFHLTTSFASTLYEEVSKRLNLGSQKFQTREW
jgi:hypothetical protein